MIHSQPKRVILLCNTTLRAQLIPLSFDVFLVALCTLYAFKTRNLPENFNEAKLVGICMLVKSRILVDYSHTLASNAQVYNMCHLGRLCANLSEQRRSPHHDHLCDRQFQCNRIACLSLSTENLCMCVCACNSRSVTNRENVDKMYTSICRAKMEWNGINLRHTLL